MSAKFRFISWNPFKKTYDLFIVLSLVIYIALFVVVSGLIYPGDAKIADEVLIIRAFGSAAIIMLHIILAIGPLARFSPQRFKPLLYNRRHLGVSMFLVSLVHGALSTVYYHGFGVISPIESMLDFDASTITPRNFPYELLGLGGLGILFLMAITSHDFWLAKIGAPIWKALHMGVYLAYLLLIAHVALGVLQSERSLVYPVVLGVGFVLICGLHLGSAIREFMQQHSVLKNAKDGEYIALGKLSEIPESKAKMFDLGPKERIAVFRYEGKLSAVANACRHQNGPLGEGRIIKGCIVCPWHGYEYNPANGQSPPPFTEKVATYKLLLKKNIIYVHPKALPPGTPIEPALIP